MDKEERVFYMKAVGSGMCTYCHYIKAKSMNDAKAKIYNHYLKKEDDDIHEIEGEELIIENL